MNDIPASKARELQVKLQVDVADLRKIATQAESDGNGNVSFVLNQVADHIERGNAWDLANLLACLYTGMPLSPDNKLTNLCKLIMK